MKLIFWLLLSVFQYFSVYGNGKTQSAIIDTEELNDEHRALVEWISKEAVRNKVKKNLWERENDKEIIRNKEEIIRNKKEIIRNNTEIIRNHKEIIRNNYFTYVSCAMTQINTLLHRGYRINAKNSHLKDSNTKEYMESLAKGYECTDIYALIEQDAKWMEKYDYHSTRNISYMTIYSDDIMTYKQVWYHYLFTTEGYNLSIQIAPEDMDKHERYALFSRFSFNMSRLFKIARVTCRQVLEILRNKILADTGKTLRKHLEELIPEWSLTGEQIRHYNILLKFILPNYPDSGSLKAIIFKNATIANKHKAIFVIPYTMEYCGSRASDEEDYFV